MTSNKEKKQTQEDQIDALLALLPELKNELNLAGYQKKHKMNLLARIDEQYLALKDVQYKLEGRGPFLYHEIEQPITALKYFKFPVEVHHVDEIGHCQVQIVSNDEIYGVEDLLAQIEREQCWPDCFRMLKNQSLHWLLQFSENLKNDKLYHTLCQIELFRLMDNQDDLLMIIQNADSWCWSPENYSMIPKVLAYLKALSKQDFVGELDKELTYSILHRVQTNLEIIHDQYIAKQSANN